MSALSEGDFSLWTWFISGNTSASEITFYSDDIDNDRLYLKLLLYSCLNYIYLYYNIISYRTFYTGRPDSLENCSVVNQTSASLMVRCQPGFDGGLSQRFVMEVYDRHGQSLAGNVTADRPAFTVGSLPSGLGFDISVYAYNSRGPSDPIQLHAYTLKSAEKRTGMDDAQTSIIIITISVVEVTYIIV